jgi:hypothetical protein
MNQELENLKKEGEEKYERRLSFFKDKKFDFSGDYTMYYSDDSEKYPHEGKLEYKPVGFDAKYSTGDPTLYLIMDVVFSDIKINGKNVDLKTSLESLSKSIGLDKTKILKVMVPKFPNIVTDVFRDIKKYVGMSDVRLIIRDIDIE